MVFRNLTGPLRRGQISIHRSRGRLAGTHARSVNPSKIFTEPHHPRNFDQCAVNMYASYNTDRAR